MNALSVEVADALVAEVNQAPLSATLRAARAYVPTFVLDEISGLQVTVVPRATRTQSSGRRAALSEIDVDLAVQKKLSVADLAEIDLLMDLVEEIADYVRQCARLTGVDAAWSGTQNDPIYVPEHLSQYRVFTSVLTFTFLASR